MDVIPGIVSSRAVAACRALLGIGGLVLVVSAAMASPPRAILGGQAVIGWSVDDSVAACPAGDSVAAAHPSRARVRVTLQHDVGGNLEPWAGVPPESIWAQPGAAGGNAGVNDQSTRVYADDSTDAAGVTRITLVSLSGCGTVSVTLTVFGEALATFPIVVRSADSNGDGRVDGSDTPCDLDYDGTAGAADAALAAPHAQHTHRQALFGTLVRRTNLCEDCCPFCYGDVPNTIGESTVSWSPDGRHLAFTIHTPPDGDCAVFIVPSDPRDGDAPAQFTFPASGVHDYDPAWSPLGTEIAFGRADNTIWVKGIPGINPDTSLRLVTRHNDGTALERGDLTPAFSPEGEWIAFARKTSEAGHYEIWKTPANGDTTRRVQLTFESDGDDLYPQWSSDGVWIVFDRVRAGQHGAWRVPAAGGAAEPVADPGGGWMASTPAFSPDGAALLAGMGDATGAATFALPGTLAHLTLPSAYAVGSYAGFAVPGTDPVLSPRLSPDGTRLALRTEQLYAARRNMSAPPRITALAGQPIADATPFVEVNALPGATIDFRADAVDPEGDPITWSAAPLRPGMAFDAQTRTFTWTPDAGDAGATYPVRFQATTPSGGADYAIARIRVDDFTDGGRPRTPTLLRLWSEPNPFDRGARILLELPSAGDVAVEIYDTAGRRVRDLLRRALPAGRHTLQWDGADAAGRALPAGVYLCRVRADVGCQELRMVRLR